MTPDNLRELIELGVSLSVEFKGEKSGHISDQEIIEAVVCLANRPAEETGWFLIGVEDDGRITGARPRHECGRTDIQRIQALIANRTRPSLSCRTEIITIGDKSVITSDANP